MTNCPSCSATIAEDTAYCGACGAPSGHAVGGSEGSNRTGVQSSGMASNLAGLLTYVLGLITGIIFLVIEPYKNNKFVRFHAFQSIFFSVALFVFWIVWSVASSILGFTTFGVVGLAMAGIGLLIALGAILYWCFLMYKAYRNERYRIPYLGEFAAKQAEETA